MSEYTIVYSVFSGFNNTQVVKYRHVEMDPGGLNDKLIELGISPGSVWFVFDGWCKEANNESH